jgi:hypothetical protein
MGAILRIRRRQANPYVGSGASVKAEALEWTLPMNACDPICRQTCCAHLRVRLSRGCALASPPRSTEARSYLSTHLRRDLRPIGARLALSRGGLVPFFVRNVALPQCALIVPHRHSVKPLITKLVISTGLGPLVPSSGGHDRRFFTVHRHTITALGSARAAI